MVEAHAPSEEARFNAALARNCVEDGWNVRFVLGPGALDEGSVDAAFREELGLPRNYRPRRTLSHPVARLFFHALELKREGYEVCQGLEFAQLLQFTLNRFHDIGPKSTRAGVKKGLGDWLSKAEERGDEEMLEFAAFLEEVDRIIPAKGHAGAFADAVSNLAELCGIGELARRAHGICGGR